MRGVTSRISRIAAILHQLVASRTVASPAPANVEVTVHVTAAVVPAPVPAPAPVEEATVTFAEAPSERTFDGDAQVTADAVEPESPGTEANADETAEVEAPEPDDAEPAAEE